MIRKLINIYYSPDRQRLVRFNMLKKQLCPLCGNLVYFSNKDNAYMCRNEQCSFKEEKIKEVEKTEEQTETKTL